MSFPSPIISRKNGSLDPGTHGENGVMDSILKKKSPWIGDHYTGWLIGILILVYYNGLI